MVRIERATIVGTVAIVVFAMLTQSLGSVSTAKDGPMESQFIPTIIQPSNGAVVSGSVQIAWSGYIDYEDTWYVACDQDGAYPYDYIIATLWAQNYPFPTTYWSCIWNTATVPNGAWEIVVIELGFFNINPVGASINVVVANPDITAPMHSSEYPLVSSYTRSRTPTVSVKVADPSGVSLSSVKLWLDGTEVAYQSGTITSGYNISYAVPEEIDEGSIVLCRIYAQDISGNALDFAWQFTVLHSANIILNQGWNLVSLPLAQVDATVGASLSTIAGKWSAIMTYNATSNDHWKTNIASRADALDDLKSLNHRSGYWINVTQAGGCTLAVYGLPPSSTAIQLRAGWNLVGYPSSRGDLAAAIALWGTGADSVESFDPAELYMTSAMGAMQTLTPGYGYWMHVSADTVWTVTY
ncbi:MAG: hypothetical protein V1934_08830 [Methanobacteriota archaeon]